MSQEAIINKKKFFFIILISVLTFFFYFLLINSDKRTKIVFCDVGQGDGAYIRIKNKIDVLIDAGPNKKILSCLGRHMPFWDKQIEIAFISHPNKDHYQGFCFINERYKIINLIITETKSKKDSYRKLIKNLKNRNTKIFNYLKDEKITIEKNIYFNFYWPEKELYSEKDNHYSQIVLYNEKDFKILFTGDADYKIFQRIKKELPENIDILKIPHHGSKTSINKEILYIIKPKIAVISTGKNNPYGHPSKEILKILEALNIKIKRTDLNGDITFKINN